MKHSVRVNMLNGTQQKRHIPSKLITTNALIEAVNKITFVKRKIAKHVAKEIQSKIGQGSVLYACDSTRISTKAYKAIFDTSKEACYRLGIKSNILPNPYQVLH